MTTTLSRRDTNAVVPGSFTDLAQRNGQSLAETFIGCEAVCLVDTSGSMGTCDARGGRERYEVACEELASLQAGLPGKVGVIAFSGDGEVMFCPAGKPFNFGGATDLAGALAFAHVADVPDMRFVVISDGQPDDPNKALREACRFQARIDVIYVGPEHNQFARDFMNQLARAGKGEHVTVEVAKLAATTAHLLTAA